MHDEPSLTVGSLFSGIGGLDLGLERAGMRVRWQCEIDPYCRAVLAHHWPGVKCYEDIRDIDGSAERVDLICGGFPCQPVSSAGKRLGHLDPRWLWPEFARVIGDLRPGYVLVENVPGLASKGLRDVVADLSALGYDAEWDVVSAASVGAPHIRERIFIVAHRQGGGCGWRRTEMEAHPRFFGRSKGADVEARGTAWAPEPDVGRVAHGVPARTHRLRCLGNAVVPQVAEAVGRMILETA